VDSVFCVFLFGIEVPDWHDTRPHHDDDDDDDDILVALFFLFFLCNVCVFRRIFSYERKLAVAALMSAAARPVYGYEERRRPDTMGGFFDNGL
jgi:hypothetical protein